jgi:hypothetical protein
LKKTASLVAKNAGHVSSKPATFQRPSVATKNKIKKLEEEERRRRIATPLTKEQKLTLKSMSNSVAEAARQWNPKPAQKVTVMKRVARTTTTAPAPVTRSVPVKSIKKMVTVKEGETGLQEPLEVRKGIVDKLSHELFDRISSKILKERR